MALIILMVFNAPIMAISHSQPNSSHSINETPGLLHPISTLRHTTFGGSRSDTSQLTQHILRLQETLRLLFQTKCSHLTLGFLHGRSAKQSLPTATTAPQPPGHGNIFFCSIISWTLLCILHGSSKYHMYLLDRRSSFGRHPPGVKDFTIIV